MGCTNSKVTDGEKAKPAMLATKERKCRDIFWLLLFIAYWVGMVAVLVVGITYGDTARLLYATDVHGNQCGSGTCLDGTTCGRYIVYPRIEKDLLLASESGTDITDPTALLSVPYTGICVSACPTGISTVNADNLKQDWVCDYAAMDALNTQYDTRNAGMDVPSESGRAVLEGCLARKGSYPFAELALSDSEDDIAGHNNVQCSYFMSNCYKMYAKQTDLFFRCIPETETNSTCMESPYLESIGASVTTMTSSSGEVVPRPASNAYCGTCLDPELDSDGNPMDPSSELCKAKQTTSMSATLEEASNPVFEQINTWTSLFTRWIGDIELTMAHILASGGAVAFILGCIWLVLLRFFAGTFVWLSIWALLASFAFLTVQFLIQGNVISVTAVSDVLASITSVTDGTVNATSAVSAESVVQSLQVFQDQEASQEKLFRILGYIMLGITVFFLLLILTMMRKIRLAIGVLKEATKVVAAMPSILLFPGGTIAASLGICIYSIYVSMLIVSSGEITEITVQGVSLNITGATSRRLSGAGNLTIADTIVSEFQSSNLNTWLFVYNFFGFLWTNQFIAAIGATTIAGAVSSWYWASEFEKEKSKKMPRRPVLAALYRTFRFHLGSLAFGAFVIALVQLIRAALAYLDKQTSTLQKQNKVVKYVMKAVQCCLWCFEKILKFITKHAYIMIALRGSSFCTATREGFMILLTNLAKIGVATAINNLMLLVAKLVITSGSGIVCWLTVNYLIEDEAKMPSSAIVPVVVAVLLAWYTASAVMSVYALAVDTIMICFCEDERRNDGSPNKPYYMSASLRRITRKSNKIYEKEQSVKQTARNSSKDDDDGDDDGPSSPDKKPSEPTLQPKSPSKAPML